MVKVCFSENKNFAVLGAILIYFIILHFYKNNHQKNS